jgi:LPXTG-site transpeptidase (sortase) family protein
MELCIMLIFKSLRKFFRTKSALSAGLVFLLIGLILMGLSLYGPLAAAGPDGPAIASNNDINHVALIKGTPVRIQIPNVGIDLKVIPGHYYPSSKSWTLSLNDAQYGVMTAPANNVGGETFIYAHYRKGVFLTLPKIQTGSTAIITTNNNHVFTYTYRYSRVTNPTDTSLFTYKGKPILVLQTCSGTWYQNRQLFVFDFKEVK